MKNDKQGKFATKMIIRKHMKNHPQTFLCLSRSLPLFPSLLLAKQWLFEILFHWHGNNSSKLPKVVGNVAYKKQKWKLSCIHSCSASSMGICMCLTVCGVFFWLVCCVNAQADSLSNNILLSKWKRINCNNLK